MKTYDCFTFFNELDVLEFRLQELYDTVDYFVIAEANMSHSGKPKEYILLDNWDRYKPYADKIRRVQVDDMDRTVAEHEKLRQVNNWANTPESWIRERYQRWSLEKGLKDRKPEDIIITSDLDEIPRAEMIQMIQQDENNYARYILGIPMFQYKINYMKWIERSRQFNIIVTRGRVYTDPQEEREYTFPWIPDPEDIVYIDHGGWHFTYFGDDAHAITKIQNFAHTETDTPDMIARHNIEWMVKNKYGHHGVNQPERFEIVRVDDYFPKCITDNLDKWSHQIAPNAVFRVTDLYREDEAR